MNIDKVKVKKVNFDSNYKLNRLLYYLIRFYMIFAPAYMLIVKLIGVREATYWKEIAYLICFIFGFTTLIRSKFILIYIILIFCTFLLELLRFHSYFEYFTWLIMGLPLILYFQFVTAKDYLIDCYIIGGIIVFSLLWVVFFESTGKYSYFFVKESDTYSLTRDDLLRVRSFFVSPMALSQYMWFATLVIFTNQNIVKPIKIVFISSALIVIFICNTRAAILLSCLTLIIYVYNKYFKSNRILTFALIVFFVLIIVVQMLLSISSGNSNVSVSDFDRINAILFGFESISHNFLFGMGGMSFSSRSGKVLIFENAYLPFVNSFGFLGLLIVLLLLYILVYIPVNKKILLFTIPWVSYSFIFPVYQEITPLIINWFIIGMILNQKRINKLLNAHKKIVSTK